MAYFENGKILCCTALSMMGDCCFTIIYVVSVNKRLYCVKCRNSPASKQSEDQPTKRNRYSAQQAVKAVMVCLSFNLLLPVLII